MASNPPQFLRSLLGSYNEYILPLSTRPNVTLTFAQSLDAKIAGAEGRQLILSGKESMVMTHWMRTMHDAILVGIGTALNDDPQLNVRHLPPPPTSTPHHLPRPIIVDGHLRLPSTCKLLKNFQNNIGRRPWVLCAPTSDDEAKQARKKALEAAGAKIIEVSSSEDTTSIRLSIPAILATLRDLGIRSLMVEGGARIIASFLTESVVDTLIITIAPVLVGGAGVGYEYPTVLSHTGDLVPKFEEVHTEVMGRDTVVSLLAVK